MKTEKKQNSADVAYTRSCKKLIKHVGAVLALASQEENIEYKHIKVEYRFINAKAYLYIPSIVNNDYDSGLKKLYNWSFIDKLSELSNNMTISYQIGVTLDSQLFVEVYL